MISPRLAGSPGFPVGRGFSLRDVGVVTKGGVAIVVPFGVHRGRCATPTSATITPGRPRLEKPLSRKQVDASYAGDARMWTILQRLRKADRWWQRNIRRRTYSILLPPAVNRGHPSHPPYPAGSHDATTAR